MRVADSSKHRSSNTVIPTSTTMSSVSRRASRTFSVLSDDLPHQSPQPSAAPVTRRSGMRGMRTASTAPEIVEDNHAIQIPAHYLLPPTVPSPFRGSLETSLDAILQWGAERACVRAVSTTLLEPVCASTNWPELLQTLLVDGNELGAHYGRYLVTDVLFLVTRTLLPEQIAENRAALGRLYERRKQLAIRVTLRYDMVRECQTIGGAGRQDMCVASVPAAQPAPTAPRRTPNAGASSGRRELMPNIISTLIAAPAGGWSTHGVRERMRHHVTGLDACLLLGEEEVEGWSESVLVGRVSQIVLQWQWRRRNNQVLEDMEVNGWEELEQRADECEWIGEKVERGGGKRDVREKGGGEEALLA